MLTEEQIDYAKNDVRFLHQLKDQLAEDLDAMKLTAVFEMESRLLPIIAAHGNPRLCRRYRSDEKSQGDCRPQRRETRRLPAKRFRRTKGSTPHRLRNYWQLSKRTASSLRIQARKRSAPLRIPGPRQFFAGGRKTNFPRTARLFWTRNIRDAFTPGSIRSGPSRDDLPADNRILQNVTRGPLRSAFIPSGPDRRLIVADYSQIELRVAALIAKETVMIDAFKTKADLHKMTAAAVLQKPVEEVTKYDRQMAKAVSFGFLYGQSAKGFVAYARTTYGLSLRLEDAERFRENFFSTYPAFRRWHAECRRKSADPGNDSARTVMGRLLLAKKDDDWARFNMFTEYVVSGSCADLIKMAMIKVASVIPSDVHLVATVHDELVYDAPADMAKQYCDVVRYAMEDAFIEMFGNAVPVEVEAKVCSNWGEK